MFVVVSVCAFFVAYPEPGDVEPQPAAGSGAVPTNVVIVVGDEGVDFDLVDDGGALVGIDRAGAIGDAGVPLVRILPLTELAPQTHYTLFAVDVDPNGVRNRSFDVTDFTTGDGADDESPVVDVSFVEFVEDEETGFDDAVLAVTGADDVVFVDVRENQGASHLLPVRDGQVTVGSATGATDVVFSVVALDAAGNASEPVDVDVNFDVDPPCCKTDAGGGCAASSSSSSSLALTLMGLGLLRVRRRTP